MSNHAPSGLDVRASKRFDPSRYCLHILSTRDEADVDDMTRALIVGSAGLERPGFVNVSDGEETPAAVVLTQAQAETLAADLHHLGALGPVIGPPTPQVGEVLEAIAAPDDRLVAALQAHIETLTKIVDRMTSWSWMTNFPTPRP